MYDGSQMVQRIVLQCIDITYDMSSSTVVCAAWTILQLLVVLPSQVEVVLLIKWDETRWGVDEVYSKLWYKIGKTYNNKK